MNFYERVAQAASKISELGVPAQVRVPNRHEVRRLQSFEDRQRQKFEEAVLKYFLKKKKYPTAHQMPKPARLYRKPASKSANKPIFGVNEFTVRLSPEGQARLVELLGSQLS